MHPPPQGPPGAPPNQPQQGYPPQAYPPQGQPQAQPQGFPQGQGYPPGQAQQPAPGAAPASEPAAPSGGISSAAARKRARRAEKSGGGGAWELIVDKAIDFALIFVGLYAATSLQRCQDATTEKEEYVSLLRDFKRELQANREQEASIEKDLGAIEETEPGKNLGPMQETFHHFFGEMAEDEKIVKCMHDEFLVEHNAAPSDHGKEAKGDHGKEAKGDHGAEGEPSKAEPTEDCHKLYAQFDKGHGEHEASFSFEPAVLTPFYRREVWQLYLADGVKGFRNKELAVRIAEVYANADLVEEQISDIEHTYNEAFMPQVGRTAATDMELAEIVHDEETEHGLSTADRTLLVHVDEAIKNEHYAALEVERTLELKAERMKKTVLLMRAEIESVQEAIDEELNAQGWKAEDGEEE